MVHVPLQSIFTHSTYVCVSSTFLSIILHIQNGCSDYVFLIICRILDPPTRGGEREKGKRDSRLKSMVKSRDEFNELSDDSSPFSQLHHWRANAFLTTPLTQTGFQTYKHGEIGLVAREKEGKAWWNWLDRKGESASASDDSSFPQLHPWLNPELHPWSDLDWQGINSEDKPKSLQFQVHLKTFQVKPTVDLWLSILAAPVQQWWAAIIENLLVKAMRWFISWTFYRTKRQIW